jgi:hypothetical protein
MTVEKPLRTLTYKRTHEGDPDPETGVFGIHKCMGRVRGWSFDAVIGVGGIGAEPERHGIAGKLTWIGIGPHKTGDPQYPLVTFDHFLYYGKQGPLFEEYAPELAKHMYDWNVRVIISLSDEERLEVDKILSLAKSAPPSGQLRSGRRRDSKQITVKCGSDPCRAKPPAPKAEQMDPVDKERCGWFLRRGGATGWSARDTHCPLGKGFQHRSVPVKTALRTWKARFDRSPRG